MQTFEESLTTTQTDTPANSDQTPIPSHRRDCLKIAPRISILLVVVFVILGVAIGFAPRAFDIPAGWRWLAFPSTVPFLVVFGFGVSFSLFRLLQLLVWSFSYEQWRDPLYQHASRRLGAVNSGLTPEAMHQFALSETYKTLRTHILSTHWFAFFCCFVLLAGAIPITLLHLQSLGRQTDLLSAMWIPATIIVGSSWIWICTVLAGIIAARALNRWRAELSEQYAEWYVNAINELDNSIVNGNVESDEQPDDGYDGSDDSFSFGLPDAEPDADGSQPDNFFPSKLVDPYPATNAGATSNSTTNSGNRSYSGQVHSAPDMKYSPPRTPQSPGYSQDEDYDPTA